MSTKRKAKTVAKTVTVVYSAGYRAAIDAIKRSAPLPPRTQKRKPGHERTLYAPLEVIAEQLAYTNPGGPNVITFKPRGQS